LKSIKRHLTKCNFCDIVRIENWDEKGKPVERQGPLENLYLRVPGRDSVVGLVDFTRRGKVTGQQGKSENDGRATETNCKKIKRIVFN